MGNFNMVFLFYIYIYQVSYFRDEAKFFEYMKGRKVPFKNFTLEGAAIDVSVYCLY